MYLLNDSPELIIACLMIDIGLGVDPGTTPQNELATSWPVYFSKEPDTPDNVITVYGTAGQLDGVTNPDAIMNEHLGFQVRVRAQSNVIGMQKANAIAYTLLKNVNQALVVADYTKFGSNSQYTVWTPLQKGPILPLGAEAPNTHRRLWTINFIVPIEPTGSQ